MSHFLKVLNLCKSYLTNNQVCCNVVKSVQVTPVRTEYSWPGYGSRYGFTSWRMKKDFMKRQCMKELYAERMRYRALRKNKILPKELREIAEKESRELPSKGSPLLLVNRCVLTGRGRGTKTQYRISRIMYKHFADYGKMSGVTRACW